MVMSYEFIDYDDKVIFTFGDSCKYKCQVKANANHIIKAVNSHDILLQALATATHKQATLEDISAARSIYEAVKSS